MSFRKEKKFKLTKFEFDLLKNQLYDDGMYLLHKKRIINSLYYDNLALEMFHDSEEGLLPRKKVRVRWYNDLSEFSTEVKTSSLEGRFKTTNLCEFTSREDLPSSIFDSDYGDLYPSLLVSYNREYFSYKDMRLTFDSHIRYINHRHSSYLENIDPECVMEIKVSADFPDDYIINCLSIPTTRFSKYCRGLLSTNFEL